MKKKKVLLIRLDKIGDLICTLPVDLVLDESVYDVTWVIQKGLGPLVDLGSKKRKYFELDKNSNSSAELFRQILKNEKFDIAVSFQCPWWVNFELFRARIKKRIGVLSQWHSFLFLDQGLRQKRSLALKHEFEYNLELVEKIIGKSHLDSDTLIFDIQKPSSTEVLDKYGLSTGQYQVVHPGMMGSALNWPQEKYIEYIHRLLEQGKKIIITGTSSDTPYLLKIKSTFENNPQVIWLQSKLNLKELVQVLYYSEKVVVPSTGVAHIAASLGKQVLGIYSPIRVHHPRRWAPRGAQVEILLPKVDCPAAHECLKEKCVHYDCMQKIEIN